VAKKPLPLSHIVIVISQLISLLKKGNADAISIAPSPDDHKERRGILVPNERLVKLLFRFDFPVADLKYDVTGPYPDLGCRSAGIYPCDAHPALSIYLHFKSQQISAKFGRPR
jgi:hypothetical protein